MSFRASIENRYTTKNYDPSKRLQDHQLNDLKEILRLAPSSINSQPWKFTFVRDEGVKATLADASMHNKQKILDADTVVVFSRIDHIDAFERQLREEHPEFALNYFLQHLKPRPVHELLGWFDRQVYLALGMFLSACAAMGIDSTPMEGIEPAHYDEILELEDYHTLVAVAIGYRDEEDFNQPSKRPKTRKSREKVVKEI